MRLSNSLSPRAQRTRLTRLGRVSKDSAKCVGVLKLGRGDADDEEQARNAIEGVKEGMKEIEQTMGDPTAKIVGFDKLVEVCCCPERRGDEG